ncbi:hydrolase [Clostridium kluyveri]|uniref:hydrolase n=1 Tax=Clostridium kluyveri TaxID=1534 RepID=UPI002247FBF2|nr:hydrolase [Clostridium kluyveri]UZQ50766.1 hydrolase [Clostridium kluyveri]
MLQKFKKYILVLFSVVILISFNSIGVLADDSNIINLGTRTITDVNKTWTITFNADVDFSSIPGNIQIEDITTSDLLTINPMQGESKSVVIVKAPSEGYTVDHNYLITVNKNIKLESGTPLSKTTTLNFIVASKEDNEYTLSADITVSPIISVFKQITVTSTNLPGASKYKIDENNKLFDIGETTASLISEDTVKVYICDSSGNVLGTADMDVSSTKSNMSLKLQ